MVSRGDLAAYTRDMGRGIVVAAGMLASVVCGGVCSASRAADGGDIHATAERVLAATASVACVTDGGSFSGSAFVISAEGHVLTAASAVPAGAAEVSVLLPGYRRRPASIVTVADSLGVTLLKVQADEPLAFLPLARTLPTVGDVVFTAADVDDVMLANGRASFSRGVVSGLYDVEPQPEAAYAGRVIETTAAVNPGSDGGPLVDATGCVVGVISLAVSPRRWQGVAVPMTVLLDRLSGLAACATQAADAAPPVPDTLAGLRRSAAAVTPFLVGIDVERTWPAEELPRCSWAAHRGRIADWAALSDADRAKRFAAFAALARTLDVNQLLRRPAGSATGVVLSDEGFVLTSSFNVGDDTAFVAKATGRPRSFAVDESVEQLLAEPAGGFAPRPNPIRRVTVVLANGSRREARVHARHEPLGVALLRVEGPMPPGIDLAGAATSPQLGDQVAAVGLPEAGADGVTFNPGIVSAASRNRGYRFQTDALLNYGNSGGPVVDAAGSLLGIATAPIEPDTVMGRIFPLQQLMRWNRAPNSGVGFVARADRIRAALDDLKAGRSFEKFPGPFLGVQADESRALGEDVVIGFVAEGSPAARAGLRKGDVVLAYDGMELAAWRELTERIAAARPGDSVTLTIRRKQKGPRLVIAGRDVETLEDLERVKMSLQPGATFEGRLVADDVRDVSVVLGENK
ncbi:MAG: trypsin-like peptidase domain-containing protein [Planctomycetaceae bacterium]